MSLQLIIFKAVFDGFIKMDYHLKEQKKVEKQKRVQIL